MNDPLITELFPEMKSILARNDAPENQIAVAADFFKHWTSVRIILNTLRGKFDLSNTLIHYASNFFPTPYCRKNLLHIQMLCSATFSKKHYTIRQDIPSYLLLHTFYGEGVLKYEGRTYSLQPNDVCLIDCRAPHEYYCSSEGGWGYRFLHFDGIAMPGYYIQIKETGNVKFTFEKGDQMDSLWKELILANHNCGPNSEILSNRIITDMITEILCHLPHYQTENVPETVKDMQNYIEDHFSEDITLDDIARNCRISKYHMSRLFKKYVHRSVIQYVLDCRIVAAQKMLRYSNYSIQEISEKVGFNDTTGFYRAFLQRTDVSPSEYRKYGI